MSPRPATFTQDQLNARVFASVVRRGPEATLKQIGEDVGLTGARVGQLYGSKDKLLVAMARYYGARIRAQLDEVLRPAAPPLERLVEGLSRIARGYVSPDEFPNAVRLLRTVDDSPEYRRIAKEYQQVHDGFVRTCLREAMAAGHLERAKLSDLVDAVIVVANGVYFTHVMRRDRSLVKSLRVRLEALLAPGGPRSSIPRGD